MRALQYRMLPHTIYNHTKFIPSQVPSFQAGLYCALQSVQMDGVSSPTNTWQTQQQV